MAGPRWRPGGRNRPRWACSSTLLVAAFRPARLASPTRRAAIGSDRGMDLPANCRGPVNRVDLVSSGSAGFNEQGKAPVPTPIAPAPRTFRSYLSAESSDRSITHRVPSVEPARSGLRAELFPMHDRIAYQGITFDDVLLEPGYADLLPHETDTRSHLTARIDLNIPILSSPMDTVTEAELAIAPGAGGRAGRHPQEHVDRGADRARSTRSSGPRTGSSSTRSRCPPTPPWARPARSCAGTISRACRSRSGASSAASSPAATCGSSSPTTSGSTRS